MSRASRFFEGSVLHHRLAPKEHRFEYKLFMVHLFLDELPDVFGKVKGWSALRPSLAWFRRRDYFQPETPCLEKAIRGEVAKRTGHCPTGRISMLTHLRYFGFIMNPVTFYVCWSEDESHPEFILAEITNTPWSERHTYMIEAQEHQRKPVRKTFKKSFHVSPFMPMDQSYAWSFDLSKEHLSINMKNQEDQKTVFFVGLNMDSQPITQRTATRCLFKYPFITLKVALGIYVQAFKLWRKSIPLYDHPNPHSRMFCWTKSKEKKGDIHVRSDH